MIVNSKHEIVSQKEIVCNNFLSQARGLMFRKKKNLLMVFNNERKVSLHNFFVFYPIQVLVLNKNKVVIDKKDNFKPFTFWKSKQKGQFIVELAYPTQINIGEKLKF